MRLELLNSATRTWRSAALGGAVLAVFLSLTWTLGACGDDDNPADGTPQATGGATTTGDAASPRELADEVAQHYFDALDELDGLLKQELPPDALASEVRSLKDGYIETFVSYGHKREAMSNSERVVFDARVQQAINLSTPGALDTIGAANSELIGEGETELADEIMSFNIITQYTFFELLKMQEPEEAERLGIP